MELNLEMRQSQVLSQQQIQSMKILQMNRQELLEHINESVVENPLLDASDNFEETENREFLQKLRWLGSEDTQNRHYYKADAEDQCDALMNISSTVQEESLLAYLEMQLDEMELTGQMRQIAGFIAANLSDNGYLEDTEAELAECLGVSVQLIAEAVHIIKSLNPAGVGASNIAECLKLQLSRMEDTQLPIQIVENYLEKLSKNQYGFIAKSLDKTTEQVRDAADIIRSLNPKPGSDFSYSERPLYILPDIVIVKLDDHFEILIGDYEIPSLSINKYYLSLLKDSNDKELKDYLGKKVQKARWLINAIGQRMSTLLKCAQAILAVQKSFFTGQSKSILPLTMAELSEMVGVHESTVSRTIKGKYLQCSQGVFPMSYFFSRKSGNMDISTDKTKKVLQELVDGEDKAHPLSDMQVVQKMLEMDIKLSRRTVAKYRMELLIPNTSGRRSC
ncbi:MAG: RNA polymerase factor sigma-54 [Lachnospiraceae bacterium]